jgi:hypothetical protein
MSPLVGESLFPDPFEVVPPPGESEVYVYLCPVRIIFVGPEKSFPFPEKPFLGFIYPL